MEKCPECGSHPMGDARFCHVCGAELGGSATQEFSVSAEDLTRKVSDLIHEGNVSRIIVKDDEGKPLLEIPVTAGVVGALVAPLLAVVGVAAVLAGKYRIAVVRRTEPSRPRSG
ncbi:MAG: DUF4342 domain-containing protein [Nitrososphaerales archaeon]